MRFVRGKVIPMEPSGGVCCPVRTLDRYLEEFRLGDTEWLFPSMIKSEKPVSGQAVSKIVKRAAEHAGLKGRYSGHSLRIGGATAALKGGMTMEQIRSVGEWESKAVLLYLRSVAAANNSASIKMGM
jgi:integrase